MGEKLVAESLSLAGPLDETGDVDELDGCRDDLFGSGEILQPGEPGVRDIHHADIRLDSAEREVCRLGLAAPGEGVEECGFTHVGKTDDACS